MDAMKYELERLQHEERRQEADDELADYYLIGSLRALSSVLCEHQKQLIMAGEDLGCLLASFSLLAERARRAGERRVANAKCPKENHNA